MIDNTKPNVAFSNEDIEKRVDLSVMGYAFAAATEIEVMYKTKTTETDKNVTEFIEKVENPVKRNDSNDLLSLFTSLTGFEPKMWGPTIIGFGTYHYKYATGHEGDASLAGFSPRKDSIVLYFASEFKTRKTLLAKLGKHKEGKACVYVKKLEDINLSILEQMITDSVEHVKQLYPD